MRMLGWLTMRDERRPYQRPINKWRQPPRRRRAWRTSVREWVIVAAVGFVGLSALTPRLASNSGDGESAGQPAALLDQSAYYANCDAARASGAAPIEAGEPGYRDKLDRDGDGVACEPFYGQ